MKTKLISITIVLAALVCTSISDAQQTAKVFRIGVLSPRMGLEKRDEVLRQSLRELGYVEGQNVLFEWRFSEGKPGRLDPLAAELVSRKVDAIFANATPTIQAVKKATTTIPIVMIAGADPAEIGLVASLERPGGNITGLTSVSTALNGKRMELAKEVVPDLTSIGVLYDPNYPTMTSGRSLQETQDAAKSHGLKAQLMAVRSVNDFESVFEAASKARAQGLIHFSHSVITNARERVAELAIKHRLAAVYAETSFVDAGGLMSLGADPFDLIRRAAGYIDRILKGAKPADMPMEKPTKFEVIINAKAAKQMNLTIPPGVLARATRIVQ